MLVRHSPLLLATLVLGECLQHKIHRSAKDSESRWASVGSTIRLNPHSHHPPTTTFSHQHNIKQNHWSNGGVLPKNNCFLVHSLGCLHHIVSSSVPIRVARTAIRNPRTTHPPHVIQTTPNVPPSTTETPAKARQHLTYTTRSFQPSQDALVSCFANMCACIAQPQKDAASGGNVAVLGISVGLYLADNP